jgi:hypothetical protein
MVGKDPGTASVRREPELRRSGRFALVIPVAVKWQNAESVIFREEAEAVEVNVYGAMLRMKTQPPVGTEVELTNRVSNEVTEARVVAIRRSKPDAIAVELLTPTESFWGVTFRLKRATDDLLKLERDIRLGGLDSSVLREFRDAVDYVRKTAWAIQELQERQAHLRDTATVRSLLTDERVRRAIQLSESLASNLDSQEVTEGTPGAANLFQATEGLYKRLARLFKSP